jgi:hypothetical protein
VQARPKSEVAVGFYFAVLLLCAIPTGIIAHDKGFAWWLMVVMAIIIPPIALIVVLCMKPNPDSRADLRRRGKAAQWNAALAAQTTTTSNRGVTAGLEVADEIARLADLRDRGVLSAEEFEDRKRKLLAS